MISRVITHDHVAASGEHGEHTGEKDDANKWHDARVANAQVSDGSQPPITLNSSPSEPAGSRSLNRLVRFSQSRESGYAK